MAGAGAAPPTIGARITPSTGNPSIALSICGTGSATGAAIAVKLETDSRKTTANKCLYIIVWECRFSVARGVILTTRTYRVPVPGSRELGAFCDGRGRLLPVSDAYRCYYKRRRRRRIACCENSEGAVRLQIAQYRIKEQVFHFDVCQLSAPRDCRFFRQGTRKQSVKFYLDMHS